jgi:hypothetical protein
MNGTPGQQLSIDRAVEAMRREGLENVRTGRCRRAELDTRHGEGRGRR